MLDQDTQSVVDRLNDSLSKSGLSLRQFARAMGTDGSRFSSYRAGRVAPSAAFLIRAERIAEALSDARRDGIPTSIDAADAIRRAARKGNGDWTYALALEARDRLREILERRRALSAAWEAQPPVMADHWTALLAAFTAHEFDDAGLPAPKWTQGVRLDDEWVLDTPRLTDAEIKRQTPRWLAQRNIFIAEKDLVTW